MAPWPETGNEPKAPDKDEKHEIVNSNATLSLDESSQNTSSTKSEQKPDEKEVLTLDEGQLKALLDEAITYKNPKDREGKSELFKELLQEAEADESDSKGLAGSLSGKLPRAYYNLPVRRRQSRHSGPSRECGVGVSNTRGGSLQNLHALGMEGGRRSRKRDTLVSARQREGGSLPTNVNVDNDPDLDVICTNFTSRATLEVSGSSNEENANKEEPSAPSFMKVQGPLQNGIEPINTKEEERITETVYASSISGALESENESKTEYETDSDYDISFTSESEKEEDPSVCMYTVTCLHSNHTVQIKLPGICCGEHCKKEVEGEQHYRVEPLVLKPQPLKLRRKKIKPTREEEDFMKGVTVEIFEQPPVEIKIDDIDFYEKRFPIAYKRPDGKVEVKECVVINPTKFLDEEEVLMLNGCHNRHEQTRPGGEEIKNNLKEVKKNSDVVFFGDCEKTLKKDEQITPNCCRSYVVKKLNDLNRLSTVVESMTFMPKDLPGLIEKTEQLMEENRKLEALVDTVCTSDEEKENKKAPLRPLPNLPKLSALERKALSKRRIPHAKAHNMDFKGVGPVETGAMLYSSAPVQHVSVLSIPPSQMHAGSDEHRISDSSEAKKLNVSRSRQHKKGQSSEEVDSASEGLLGLPLTAYWNRYSSFTLLDFQDEPRGTEGRSTSPIDDEDGYPKCIPPPYSRPVSPVIAEGEDCISTEDPKPKIYSRIPILVNTKIPSRTPKPVYTPSNPKNLPLTIPDNLLQDRRTTTSTRAVPGYAKAATTSTKTTNTSKTANTLKAATTSAKSANTPAKAANTSKAATTSAKSATTPAKAANTSKAATTAKSATTPANAANTSKAATTSAKSATTPAKATNSSKAANTLKAATTSVKAATNSAKSAITPAKAATTSVKAATNSAKSAITPAKAATTSVKAATNSAKSAITPAKAAITPAKAATTSVESKVASQATTTDDKPPAAKKGQNGKKYRKLQDEETSAAFEESQAAILPGTPKINMKAPETINETKSDDVASEKSSQPPTDTKADSVVSAPTEFPHPVVPVDTFPELCSTAKPTSDATPSSYNETARVSEPTTNTKDDNACSTKALESNTGMKDEDSASAKASELNEAKSVVPEPTKFPYPVVLVGTVPEMTSTKSRKRRSRKSKKGSTNNIEENKNVPGNASNEKCIASPRLVIFDNPHNLLSSSEGSEEPIPQCPTPEYLQKLLDYAKISLQTPSHPLPSSKSMKVNHETPPESTRTLKISNPSNPSLKKTKLVSQSPLLVPDKPPIYKNKHKRESKACHSASSEGISQSCIPFLEPETSEITDSESKNESSNPSLENVSQSLPTPVPPHGAPAKKRNRRNVTSSAEEPVIPPSSEVVVTSQSPPVPAQTPKVPPARKKKTRIDWSGIVKCALCPDENCSDEACCGDVPSSPTSPEPSLPSPVHDQIRTRPNPLPPIEEDPDEPPYISDEECPEPVPKPSRRKKSSVPVTPQPSRRSKSPEPVPKVPKPSKKKKRCFQKPPLPPIQELPREEPSLLDDLFLESSESDADDHPSPSFPLTKSKDRIDFSMRPEPYTPLVQPLSRAQYQRKVAALKQSQKLALTIQLARSHMKTDEENSEGIERKSDIPASTNSHTVIPFLENVHEEPKPQRYGSESTISATSDVDVRQETPVTGKTKRRRNRRKNEKAGAATPSSDPQSKPRGEENNKPIIIKDNFVISYEGDGRRFEYPNFEFIEDVYSQAKKRFDDLVESGAQEKIGEAIDAEEHLLPASGYNNLNSNRGTPKYCEDCLAPSRARKPLLPLPTAQRLSGAGSGEATPMPSPPRGEESLAGATWWEPGFVPSDRDLEQALLDEPVPECCENSNCHFKKIVVKAQQEDANARLAYGNTADGKTKPLDENGNALACVRMDSNCLDRKKQRRVKAKNDRNTILSDEIEGFRGGADIDTLMEYIESPSLDSKNSKARTNQSNGTRNSVKVRAKEEEPRSIKRRKDKFQRCNSLEEISKTKLEDLTEEGSSEKVNGSSHSLAKKQVTLDDAELGKKSSWEEEVETISVYEVKDPKQERISPEPVQDSEFHVVTKKQRKKKRRTGCSSRGGSKQDYYSGREGGSGRLLYQYRRDQGSSQPRRKSASSVPPSDKSDSSDLDSVHSLPVSSSTRNRVGQNSVSGGSTPQASYADIAKTAASPPDGSQVNIDRHDRCSANSSLTETEERTSLPTTMLPTPLASFKKDAMTDTNCDNTPVLKTEDYPPLEVITLDFCTGTVRRSRSGVRDSVTTDRAVTKSETVIQDRESCDGTLSLSSDISCVKSSDTSANKRPPVILMHDPSRGDSGVPSTQLGGIEFGFPVNYLLLQGKDVDENETPPPPTTSALPTPAPVARDLGAFTHVTDENLIQYLCATWAEVEAKLRVGKARYYDGQ